VRRIGGGQTNVIPRESALSVDLRNPVDDVMTAAEQHPASYVGKLAAQHDAQEISAICPATLVFVASENGSITHSFREYSNLAACADVPANAVLRLADQP
jgi:beta-ureidopropionase / N-carbamoyl-L-amino-acid hydrolase